MHPGTSRGDCVRNKLTTVLASAWGWKFLTPGNQAGSAIPSLFCSQPLLLQAGWTWQGKNLSTCLLPLSLSGVGKTTLIQKAITVLQSSGLPVDGFYTQEVRQGGKRIGFDVVTLSGAQGPLSRVGYWYFVSAGFCL